MCPAIPIDLIGTDAWNATAYRLVSLGYKISASIRSQVAKTQLASALWKFDRYLSGFLRQFYEHVESNKQSEPANRERVLAGIETLKLIHAAAEKIDSGLRAAGFSNHSLIAGPLTSLRARADEVLDLAESVELMLNPDPLNKIFDASIEELRRGETAGLESIN
jgi:hypothetical protein